MNTSNFLHALLAVLAQLVIGFISDNYWIGAAFGFAFYFGREVAQHEQHQIVSIYKKRINMPWYEGFKFFYWATDAKFDLIIPLVFVVLIAFGMNYFMIK